MSAKRDAQLTPNQASILAELLVRSALPRLRSPRESLAQATELTTPAIARAMKALEKKGYVDKHGSLTKGMRILAQGLNCSFLDRASQLSPRVSK